MKKATYYTALVTVTSVLMLITISSGLLSKRNKVPKNARQGMVINKALVQKNIATYVRAGERTLVLNLRIIIRDF